MARNKFGAIKTAVDGITFDSKGEAARYVVLRDRQEAGLIAGLRCHPSYDLTVNGKKVARYRADFLYTRDGKEVVEDFKSKATMTPVYRLKKKLVAALYGVEIIEVFTPSAL